MWANHIIFQGRKDQQVKISGHRIELGEIENRLIQHKAVRNCVVVDWEDDNRKRYLCAYIVMAEEVECEEIRDFLEGTLPDYMVPRYFERINEIPLNTNGKVNRKALKQPEQIYNMRMEVIPARTEAEKKLSEIWSRILGIKNISMKDRFLELGGDSIKMVNTLGEIEEAFNIRISFKEFMLANTIEKLAVLIEKRDGREVKAIYPKSEHNLENEYDNFSLTDVQMAYLIGRDEGFDLGGVSTHGYYEILSQLDIYELEKSLNKVIELQPMLRAVINKNGTQRIVKDVPEYKIAVKDIRTYYKEEQEKAIVSERNRMSHHIFDTEKWPLFEFKAFQIKDNTCYLFIGIDLLISDGSSIRIFIKELLNNYYHKSVDKINAAFTYKDYVEALERFKESDTYNEDKEYWMNQISLIPPAPALPLKKAISEITNPQFARCERLIGKSDWYTLKKKAKEMGITTSSLLCTAYAVVLGYWSNQSELTVNVTVFTRYPFNENVNRIIGDFTSVILLKVDLLGKHDFWELATEIQKQLMEALEHRHYDGMNVIREIAKEKDMQQQAVMPVVFTSLLFSIDRDDNATIYDLGEIKMGISQTSQVYLDYQVMETKDGLSITWDYVKELFDQDMINTMFIQYINLVEGLAMDKKIWPLHNELTKEKITCYNNTRTNIPETTIQKEFSKVVIKYAEKALVTDSNGSMTCMEADKKSTQIANCLIDKGIGKGDVVAVLGERKKETIVNVLGVLKTGAAYAAIDPEYPEERQRYILEHSESRVFLDSKFYDRNDVYKYSEELPDIKYNPEDIAYVIYTSGSTGTPKGVAITQGAVMNRSCQELCVN